jgi:hypothetical protein
MNLLPDETPPEQWELSSLGSRYLVSDAGRVLNAATGAILTGQIDSRGYRRVHLSDGGKFRKVRVHRLVCEAFHGSPPDGHEVCHRDGDRLNNRADNLAWGTRSDNVQDAIRHGTFVGNTAAALAERQRRREIAHV